MVDYNIDCKVCNKKAIAYSGARTTCNECAAKGLKYCKRCDTVKTNDEFGTSKSAKDGLQSYCKRCQVARSGGTYDVPSYICKVCGEEKQGVRRTVTCPECIEDGNIYCTCCEKVVTTDNVYYNTGRQAYMNICKQCQTAKTTGHHFEKTVYDEAYHEASLKQRREHHAEKLTEPGWREERNRKAREWREEYLLRDPEYQDRCRAYGHKYRANLRGSYTVDEWMECLTANDYKCAYCGATDNLTIDHIVAVSEGGWNYAFNLTVACGSCNSSKQARDVVEWYSKQPFYDETKLRNIHKRYRMLQDKLLKTARGGDDQ